jgi:hypothetical protein
MNDLASQFVFISQIAYQNIKGNNKRIKQKKKPRIEERMEKYFRKK